MRPGSVAAAAALMEKLQLAVETAEPPVIPEPEPWVCKNPEIMVLEDYRSIPDNFWDAWPRVPLPTSVSPIINAKRFRRRCLEAGVDQALVEKVVDRIQNGAALGARGAGRLPARGQNLSGFYEMGPRSVDTMVSWLKASPALMAGPLEPEELNNGMFRANPLQSTEKPNRSARVCVDQSWPHTKGNPVDGNVPISVNESIDIARYPVITVMSALSLLIIVSTQVRMISTKDVLYRLLFCDTCSRIVKIDLADAYKHCPVKISDLHLNAVMLGGKVFTELSCTFGCSSSPG